VSLRPVSGTPEEPVIDHEMVGFLEELVHMARNGEITGVLVALLHADGTTSDRWSLTAGHHPIMAMGAMTRLQWKYQTHVDRLYENDTP
jgi:hypothetical protein